MILTFFKHEPTVTEMKSVNARKVSPQSMHIDRYQFRDQEYAYCLINYEGGHARRIWEVVKCQIEGFIENAFDQACCIESLYPIAAERQLKQIIAITEDI